MLNETTNENNSRTVVAHNAAKNRFLFTGELLLQQALHIGSGYGDETTDALVVRGQGADGPPIIPGSSLRGALRSHTERLLGALYESGATTVWACGLFNDTLPADKEYCLGNQMHQASRTRYDEVLQLAQRPGGTEAVWADLGTLLCDACLLFGAGTFWASKIRFTDLAPLSGEPQTTIRHGVGIDRDSGTAASGVKYDKEVVEGGTLFRFEAVGENLDEADLLILALGLSQLESGAIAVGGSSGRGLGRCVLRNGEVYSLNLEDRQELVRYVTTAAGASLEARFGPGQPLAAFTAQKLAALDGPASTEQE